MYLIKEKKNTLENVLKVFSMPNVLVEQREVRLIHIIRKVVYAVNDIFLVNGNLDLKFKLGTWWFNFILFLKFFTSYINNLHLIELESE